MEEKKTPALFISISALLKREYWSSRFTSQVKSKFPMVKETKEIQTILVLYNPDGVIMSCLLLSTFHSN